MQSKYVYKKSATTPGKYVNLGQAILHEGEDKWEMIWFLDVPKSSILDISKANKYCPTWYVDKISNNEDIYNPKEENLVEVDVTDIDKEGEIYIDSLVIGTSLTDNEGKTLIWYYDNWDYKVLSSTTPDEIYSREFLKYLHKCKV